MRDSVVVFPWLALNPFGFKAIRPAQYAFRCMAEILLPGPNRKRLFPVRPKAKSFILASFVGLREDLKVQALAARIRIVNVEGTPNPRGSSSRSVKSADSEKASSGILLIL